MGRGSASQLGCQHTQTTMQGFSAVGQGVEERPPKTRDGRPVPSLSERVEGGGRQEEGRVSSSVHIPREVELRRELVNVPGVSAAHAPAQSRGMMAVDADLQTLMLELSEQWIFTILEGMGQAVHCFTLKGTIIFWNKGAEKLYGWTRDEAIGGNIVSLVCEEGMDQVAAQILAKLGRGETWCGQFPLKKRNGEVFYGNVTDSPMYHKGRLVGVIGVVSDSRTFEPSNRVTRTTLSLSELRVSSEEGAVPKWNGPYRFFSGLAKLARSLSFRSTRSSEGDARSEDETPKASSGLRTESRGSLASISGVRIEDYHDELEDYLRNTGGEAASSSSRGHASGRSPLVRGRGPRHDAECLPPSSPSSADAALLRSLSERLETLRDGGSGRSNRGHELEADVESWRRPNMDSRLSNPSGSSLLGEREGLSLRDLVLEEEPVFTGWLDSNCSSPEGSFVDPNERGEQEERGGGRGGQVVLGGGDLRSEGNGSADASEWEIPWNELKLKETIGEGSCAVVYRALWHGSDVAVKIYSNREVYAPARQRDFRVEIEVMKKLRHPNVLLFMGSVNMDEHLAIVTELMPRGTLWRLMRQNTPELDYRTRLRIALDVARGMTCLHNCHPPIIHRDLKSSNLLVASDWTVKVADFGLSRIKDADYLTAKSGRGTPQWMAPEMLRNESIDEKSDVYSFGVVLWELLTNEVPWKILNPIQVVGVVGYKQERLAIPEDADPDFADVIRQCWHENPADRPSFEELTQSLQRLQLPSLL